MARRLANEDCKMPDENFMLAILDTYHDFCKGERTTKSTKEKRAAALSDEGDEDEGDPTRVGIMRNFLPKLLKRLYTEDIVGKTYQDNVRTITCGKITSVSTVEHSAVELFEKLYKDKLKANAETIEFLTFENIIDDYNANPNKAEIPPLWKKYTNGIHNHALELSKSGRRFGKGKVSKEEEDKELEILSSFILHYFFFTDSDTNEVYMTFDAGERVVGDIFLNRKNVKCVIFPETLADSATTSLGMLGGRTEYVFPVQDKTQPDVFTSNLFSSAPKGKKYDIYFEDKGFSSQNPYGFNLVIKDTNNKKITLPFSPKQTEGPSVNYLIDILKTAQDNAGMPSQKRKQYGYILKKGTILSVGEALDKEENKEFRQELENTIAVENDDNKTNGLLPDLKRGGDHEAVLASKKAINLIVDGKKKYQNFVFCTIDILCALKSRLEGLNTIWQGKDKIILYRFPSILPEEVEKGLAIERGKEILALTEKIFTFLEFALPSALKAQKKNFEKGKTAVVNFTDRDKIHLPTKEACEIALNSLLRIKMLELVEYIDSIQDLKFIKLQNKSKKDLYEIKKFYEDFNTKSIEELRSNIEIEVNGDKRTKKYQKDTVSRNIDEDRKLVFDTYELITANIQEKINLNFNQVNFVGGKMTMTYNIQEPAVDPSTNTFLLKEHPVFGYNPAVFEKLYDCLMFVHDLTAKNEKRASRDYNKTISKILTGDNTAPFNYFALVEDVVDQFNVQTYRDEIRYILDFRGEAGAKFDGTLPKEQVEENRRLYFVGKKKDDSEERKDDYDYVNRKNGVINNMSNFFQTLKNMGKFTEDIEVEEYVQPGTAIVVAPGEGQEGGGQIGGAGDPIQFYELNDLLFKVCSRSAAFIESVWSQEIRNKDSTTIKSFLEIATRNYKIKDEYSPVIENGEHKKDAEGNFEYYYKYVGDSIYEDIGILWQAGLFDIRQNKEFLYKYTQTDDILSYLLTLQIENISSDKLGDLPIVSSLGEELTFFDSTQNKEIKANPRAIGTASAFEIYKKTLEYVVNKEGKPQTISLGVLLLFIFTLLENIMNPTKVSFFLQKPYDKIQFQSERYWNERLYLVINHLFQQVQISLETRVNFVSIKALVSGGGGIKTNQTRKAKKYSSASKTRKQSRD